MQRNGRAVPGWVWAVGVVVLLLLAAPALQFLLQPREPMVNLMPHSGPGRAPGGGAAAADLLPVTWDGATPYCPYCRSEVAQGSTACSRCTRSFRWEGTACPDCGGSGRERCNQRYAMEQLKRTVEEQLGRKVAYYIPGRQDRVVACDGSGEGKVMLGSRAGEAVPGACPTCSGSGEVACLKCGGSGRYGE